MTLAEEPGKASAAERAGLADDLARDGPGCGGWFFAAIPVACGAGILAGDRMQFVMVPWMAVWLFLIVRHGFARCPRCGGFFNWSWRGSNPFTQRCMSCDLRLDAEPLDEPSERRRPPSKLTVQVPGKQATDAE